MSVDSAIEAAVLHSDTDGIRRITMNRPEAANEGVRSFLERRPPEFRGF